VITYDDKLKSVQKTKAGSTLSLSVSVTCSPTPKITWHQAGETLSSTNGTNIETKDNFSKITFKGITAKQSGKIEVKAENKAGADSAEFNIEVKGESSQVSTQLDGISSDYSYLLIYLQTNRRI
jgi:alpha-L-arabinofuranosidase